MSKIEYLPKNTRVYAIGDIHGGLNLLKKLMAAILKNEKKAAHKDNIYLVFLGDYVDRGKHSKQVIDYFQTQLPKKFNTVFLKGNHEDIMLDALDLESRSVYKNFRYWYYCGGKTTLQSYEVPLSDDFDAMAEDFYEAISKASHLKFFKKLPVKFEIGHYFFCHAGINPKRSLKKQRFEELMWIREKFLNDTSTHEKIIVHGHTPEIPKHHGNRIGIDAGSVISGKLTAVCLEDDGSHQLLTVKRKQK